MRARCPEAMNGGSLSFYCERGVRKGKERSTWKRYGRIGGL